jgi:hypothetical protein
MDDRQKIKPGGHDAIEERLTTRTDIDRANAEDHGPDTASPQAGQRTLIADDRETLESPAVQLRIRIKNRHDFDVPGGARGIEHDPGMAARAD